MEDDGAEQIAAEWGVSVDALREATWELEEREGNDGEVYGYFVRFDEDNDPSILAELGLKPGEFLREVSINAFDEPDYDRDDSQQHPRRGRDNGYVEDGYVEDGYVGNYEPSSAPTYGSFAAFQGDSFAGQAFAVPVRASSTLVTADNSDITADNGAEPETVSFGGDDPVTYMGEPVTYTPRRRPRRRRPATTGSARPDEQDAIVDEKGNRLTFGEMLADDRNVAYQQELRSRIERLEAALETYRTHLPPRSHNHPPELVEPDPIAPTDFAIIVKSVVELKIEVQQTRPDPENEHKSHLGFWCHQSITKNEEPPSLHDRAHCLRQPR